MGMTRQPGPGGNGVGTKQGQQPGRPVHRLDGTETQTEQGGPEQNSAHQVFQRALRREVSTPSPEVDAGEHQLGTTAGDKVLYVAQAGFERQGTAMAACCRNDAEGAAVATTILHLEIGSRLAASPPA